VYDALIDEMQALLPVLLDRNKRAELVDAATREKAIADARPHVRISELDPETFATWQSAAVLNPTGAGPWGLEVMQNQIVDTDYFRNQMRRFYPGNDEAFATDYQEVFGAAIGKAHAQAEDHLPLAAKFLRGDAGLTLRRFNPETGDVTEEYKNKGDSRGSGL
jgi:hypothetical protein